MDHVELVPFPIPFEVQMNFSYVTGELTTSSASRIQGSWALDNARWKVWTLQWTRVGAQDDCDVEKDREGKKS